jgi:hypothetical protein
MTKRSKQTEPDMAQIAVPNQIIKTITKAKIVKNGNLEVVYKFTTSDGVVHNSTETSDGQCHRDLLDAFALLVPHLINIADQKEGPINPEKYEAEDGELYSVTGFVITGSGEEEGVMLIGQKLISSKSLNLITPICSLSDDYKFKGDLFETLESCKFEAQEYLNGKFAVKQLNMFEDGVEA